MKYLIGGVLIILGISAIVFSLGLRSELAQASASAEKPKLEEYPYLRIMADWASLSPNDMDAKVYAGKISRSVYLGLAIGIAFTLGGIFIGLMKGRKPSTDSS